MRKGRKEEGETIMKERMDEREEGLTKGLTELRKEEKGK